jgi:hypothetical protein
MATAKEKIERKGRRGYKHGMYGTKVYKAWVDMKDRCNNPNKLGYKNYGGRGIRVCQQWIDFKSFYADVGDPPSSLHSLDRINSNGDYEPNNVRWATRQIQNSNRRNALIFSLNGETDRKSVV